MKKPHYIKKSVCINIMMLVSLCSLFANVFFDAEGGFALDASKKSTFSVGLGGDFESQLQIGSNIIMEADVAFMVDNLFSNINLEKIPSAFSIDKFSFSYNFSDIAHPTRLTAFIGVVDNFGTDEIFQTNFGTQVFNSVLFKKQVASSQSNVIAIDGYGFEVGTMFNQNVRTSFYTYYNHKNSRHNLNVDARVSLVSKSFIGDFYVGSSMPLYTLEYALATGLKLPIRRADLSFGTTMLLGDNPYAQVFTQVGLTRLQIKPEAGNSIFDSNDLHILVEPRLVFRNINISLSFFMMPQKTVDMIRYIDYPLGAAFYIDGIVNLSNVKAVFGGYLSTSFKNAFGGNVGLSDVSLSLTPFSEFSFENSLVNISLTIKPLEYLNLDEMFSVHLSYKANL